MLLVRPHVLTVVVFLLSAGILVFKEEWLRRILAREKTLEIRGRRLKAGAYLVGCKGRIYARATTGTPIFVDGLRAWRKLRTKHRVQGHTLPYAKTWALPIIDLKLYSNPFPFTHKRGAVSIVIYR